MESNPTLTQVPTGVLEASAGSRIPSAFGRPLSRQFTYSKAPHQSLAPGHGRAQYPLLKRMRVALKERMVRISPFQRLIGWLLFIHLISWHASAQSPRAIEVVPNNGHSATVTSIALSPNGRRLLSGSWDNTVKLWDVETGQLLRSFTGHSSNVLTVALSPDESVVVAAGYDETVRMWEAETGRLIRALQGHTGQIFSVAFSSDGSRLVSCGGDGAIRLWDAKTGLLTSTIRDDASQLYSVSFSPDGRHILSGDVKNRVRLWDSATGQIIRTFVGHSGAVHSVAFVGDGTRVVSGSIDHTVKLWDTASGQLIRTMAGHSGDVTSIALMPDRAHLLSGGDDRVLRLWELETGNLIRTFSGHSLPVASVAVSPDGARVYSGSGDQTIKEWDVATGQMTRTIQGRTKPVNALAVLPGGTQLVSGDDDMTLKLWDAETGEMRRLFKGHSGPVNSVVSFPNGARILTGADDKTLKLWDTASGQLINTLVGHADRVGSVDVSPNAALLLSGGSDSTKKLKLWDVETGRLLRSISAATRHFEVPNGPLHTVKFSPDGALIASGGWDGEVRLWDVATGQLVGAVESKRASVHSATFSPDGAKLAWGTWGSERSSVEGGDIRVWDLTTRAAPRKLVGHSARVNSVVFSTDGSNLLSGSYDGTLKLWDVASGALLRSYEGHTAGVATVAFLRNSTRLVSGGLDGTIRIWNSATTQLLATLIGESGGEWLALTPEGFFAASSVNVAKTLSVVRGLEIYSFDQLYNVLYRPDLVREKLAGDPNGKVREAAANTDLAKLIDSGRVPMVGITSHNLQSTSSTDLVDVEAALTDRGGGIGRVEWRINGITVGVNEPAVAQTISLKQTVALDPGENTIELVAYNGRNLVSSVPARTKVFWSGLNDPSAPPRLHVLTIGVNDYWDGRLKLTYAVPDAKSFAESLKEAGRNHYADVSVTEVLDSDVNQRNLDNVFAELSKKVRPRDVFVFFAAGHGVTQDGRYYFIPQNFNYQTERSYLERAIGQNRLQTWFSKILAKKSIVIFDTCESGTLTGVQLASLRGGFEQLAAVGKLIKATGRTTLTAALDDQPAREGYRGHGVFTFALLDALARGDRNGNGTIEVTELIAHVDALVPEISHKTWGVRQVPRSLFQGSDFALSRQVAAVAPAPGEPMIISTRPTHVNTELLQIFKEAGGTATVVHQLPPFSTVTLVKTEQGWVLIAKDGKALGYVAEINLKKLN